MSSKNATARPMRLSLYSAVAAGRVPRTTRGIGDVLVDNDPFNKEYHLAVCAPDGRVLYDLPARCEPRGAVAVPVDASGRVALIRQWRPVPAENAADSSYPLAPEDVSRRGFWSWELPRGFPEKGESGADAARRETQEETGLQPVRVRPLGWANFNTSIMLSDQPVFGVLVESHVPSGDAHREDGESIEDLQWFSIGDLRGHVLRGTVRCGVTLSALSFVFASEGGLQRFIGGGEVPHPVMKLLPPEFKVLPTFMESWCSQMWEVGVSPTDFQFETVGFVAANKNALEKMAEALDRSFSRSENGFFAGITDGGQSSTWELSNRKIELFDVTIRRVCVMTCPEKSAREGFCKVHLSTRESSPALRARYPKLEWGPSVSDTVARFSVRDITATVSCGATG